jgi:hypothetical protein
MAKLRGKVKAPTGALIPGAQVSYQRPAAKAARQTLKHRQGFSSLPVAAQPVVSATLGRDDVRYQVRPKAGAQSRLADVPRASCPCSGMAKMAMAQSVGALSAQNPAQELEADFTPQGMEVRSGQTHWRLDLISYGYGNRLEKVQRAAPQSHDNRVEYRRGPLVEWYVNGPAGLEQGFTFNSPPPLGTRDTGYGIRDTGRGKPNSSPLTIALQLGGDLTATADLPATGQEGVREEGLTLRDSNGQALLRYTGLSAHDASGRALAAWMELGQEELRLRVEDAGARYPVVVDPFVEQAELTAADGEEYDELGSSVAVSSDGSTIVAGAPLANAAYVFVMPAGGWANMTQVAELTASKGGETMLGYSVGVSSKGSTVVAGAVSATVGSNTLQGAAYVFVMPGGGWASMTQTAELTASDGAYQDHLGWSVGVSGDGSTIVAGAPWATYNSTAETPGPGAAYVFVKPGGGWANITQTAKLTALDGQTKDQFGHSVGVSGDGSSIVAGAPYATINEHYYQGAAYVFVRPGSRWVNRNETAKLAASDGAQSDQLGYSVGVSSDGSTIAAGAYLKTIGLNTYQGAAYVFVKPGSGGWVSGNEAAKLTASDGAEDDFLGYSVGVSSDGSTIVAGAYYATANSTTSAPGPGAAYVFVKPGGGWASMTQTAKLTASDGANGDYFGHSVGVSGDGLSIEAGAPGHNISQGAAYVFLTAPTVTFTGAPPSEPYQGTFTVESTTNSSRLPKYMSSGKCFHSDTVYTMTSGTGECTSTVTWEADANYAGATLSQTTTATKIGQTISFSQTAPAMASYKNTFPVAADSTSGLTVALSVDAGSTGVCSLGGRKIVSGVTSETVTMLKGTGTCTIDAKQAGNTDFNAATEQQTSAAAQKIDQTISFSQTAPAMASYKSTFPVAADSTSGLTVALSVDAGSTGVCSLGGRKIVSGVTSETVTMLKGTGTCTIDAKQTGNADFNAATEQQTSAAAQKISQTITFTTPAPSSASLNSTFPVAADSSSGLTVALSVDAGSTGVCKLGPRTIVSGVTNATVTMLKSTGTCSIDGNQAGNGNYNAAAQVSTSATATP